MGRDREDKQELHGKIAASARQQLHQQEQGRPQCRAGAGQYPVAAGHPGYTQQHEG